MQTNTLLAALKRFIAAIWYERNSRVFVLEEHDHVHVFNVIIRKVNRDCNAIRRNAHPVRGIG